MRPLAKWILVSIVAYITTLLLILRFQRNRIERLLLSRPLRHLSSKAALPPFEFQDHRYQRTKDMAARIDHDGRVLVRLATDQCVFSISGTMARSPILTEYFELLNSGDWIELPLPHWHGKAVEARRISLDHGGLMVIDSKDRLWYLGFTVVLQREDDMFAATAKTAGVAAQARQRLYEGLGGEWRWPSRAESGQLIRYLAFGVNSWRYMGREIQHSDWQFSRVNLGGEVIGVFVCQLLRHAYVGGYHGDVVQYGIAMDVFLDPDGRSLLFRDVAVSTGWRAGRAGLGFGGRYRLHLPDGVGLKLEYSNTVIMLLAVRLLHGHPTLGFWIVRSNTDDLRLTPLLQKMRFDDEYNNSAAKWRWIDLPAGVGLDQLSSHFRFNFLQPHATDIDVYQLCLGSADHKGYWRRSLAEGQTWSYVEDPRSFAHVDPQPNLLKVSSAVRDVPLQESCEDLLGQFFDPHGTAQSATLKCWAADRDVFEISAEPVNRKFRLYRSSDGWAIFLPSLPSRWDLVERNTTVQPFSKSRVRLIEGIDSINISQRGRLLFQFTKP